MNADRFFSLYSHGFVRAAVCTPPVRIADPRFNLEQTLLLAERAAQQGCVLAIFPELGLSAYTNDDLFFQDALLDGVLDAIAALLRASEHLATLLVVGAPLRVEQRLLNCALIVYRGEVLAIVPKTYLPTYREFYEKRQFSSAVQLLGATHRLLGKEVLIGNDLIIEAENLPAFALHVEICEDLWVPLSPSTLAALGGATLLANLSASNATIGKAAYRRTLCASQSGRCVAAYLYAAAGNGESTTDLAWDGHGLIYENGELLAESQRFATEPSFTIADIDLERLQQERTRLTSFNDTVTTHAPLLRKLRRKTIVLELPHTTPLARTIDRFPFVPTAAGHLDERCLEAHRIQVQALKQRLSATGIQRVVIGVSGGLDSTTALLVAIGALDELKLPRSNILAYTLPGFATSERSLVNARRLMQLLGVSASELDIRPAAAAMLKQLGHPFSRGEPQYDITFENVQAGERTSLLFRVANQHSALVVGTSDLSELALGYTTYGVGDHMSHYSVNASVPKTLMQHLLRWLVRSGRFDAATCAILNDIVAAHASPELVPDIAGHTPVTAESVVGPFELQDFNLYYVSRYGYRPSKVLFLAHQAWSSRDRGAWPDALPIAARHEYDLATLRHWLEVFLLRFFQTSQFKRSALPNGPKVGSGGSLSPRGDWRAPSDAAATLWLEELEAHAPTRHI